MKVPTKLELKETIEGLRKQIDRDEEHNPISEECFPNTNVHGTYSSIPTANDEDWKKYGMNHWTEEDWIRFRILIDAILTETEQSTIAVNIVIQRKKYLAMLKKLHTKEKRR